MTFLTRVVGICLMLVGYTCCIGYELVDDSMQLESTKWCYHLKKCSELHWKDNCKQSVNLGQSPIDISDVDKSWDTVVKYFPRYLQKIPGFDFVYKENVFSVVFNGNPVRARFVTGAWDRNGTLHNLHFHWGERDDVGSEHTYFGRSFPAEMHLVYWNSGAYNSLQDAMKWANKGQQDCFVVISFFLEMEAHQQSKVAQNFLQPIISRLNGMEPNNSKNDPIDLTTLFQSTKGVIYTASQTSPPCLPTTWLILKRPIVIPQSHLMALRKIKLNSNSIEENNFRSLKKRHRHSPLQPMKMEYCDSIDDCKEVESSEK